MEQAQEQSTNVVPQDRGFRAAGTSVITTGSSDPLENLEPQPSEQRVRCVPSSKRRHVNPSSSGSAQNVVPESRSTPWSFTHQLQTDKSKEFARLSFCPKPDPAKVCCFCLPRNGSPHRKGSKASAPAMERKRDGPG